MIEFKNDNTEFTLSQIVIRHLQWVIGIRDRNEYNYNESYKNNLSPTNPIKICILMPLKIIFAIPFIIIYETIIYTWNLSICYTESKKCKICDSKHHNKLCCNKCHKTYVIESNKDVNEIITLQEQMRNKSKI